MTICMPTTIWTSIIMINNTIAGKNMAKYLARRS